MEKSDKSRIQKIAMLTDIYENNRQKCAAYFPDTVDSIRIFSNRGECTVADTIIPTTFINDCFNRRHRNDDVSSSDHLDEDGSDFDIATLPTNYFLIKNTAIVVKNGYSIRKLALCYLNPTTGRTKLPPPMYDVHHYWFPDWPDHRSPDDIDVLLDMSLDLLDDENRIVEANATDAENQRGSNDDVADVGVAAAATTAASTTEPLPVIHCSAGIGRTGCLAAILNGLRQMRGGNSGSALTASITNSVDVLGIVCNLRLQRGGMVQNSEQYELIHRALCLYHQRIRQQQNTLLQRQPLE